jgi:hypothetical protein
MIEFSDRKVIKLEGGKVAYGEKIKDAELIPIARIYKKNLRDYILFGHVNLATMHGQTVKEAVQGFIKRYCITDIDEDSLITSYSRMVSDFIDSPIF